MTISVVLMPKDQSSNRIVDAARVSFYKDSGNYTAEENQKLLKYLAKHRHWSPFAHVRETFSLPLTEDEIIEFMLNGNMAGFEIVTLYDWNKEGDKIYYFISGSVWAWAENIKCLPDQLERRITDFFRENYPEICFLFPSIVPFKLQNPIERHCLNTYIGSAYIRAVKKLSYETFRIRAPIFVARQLVKHQIGLSWNEVSRRYVDEEVTFYEMDFRQKAESVKQGSSQTLIENNAEVLNDIRELYYQVDIVYNLLLKEHNVAPEQARAVLPLAMETEWVWTGTLEAFKRVCNDRLAPNAQVECRLVAEQIDSALNEKYPDYWSVI